MATVRRARLARTLLVALAVWMPGVLLPGAIAPVPALAQTTPNIAELRGVIAVRDAQAAGTAEQVVGSAEQYLTEFPDGRYADEVLLALGAARTEQGQTAAALQAYRRLIEGHPDSPFRPQAMAASLPLLAASGEQAAAFERADELVKAYPSSLERSAALLWKADAQYRQGDFPGTAETLERIRPQTDLAEAQLAPYYRLQTLALVRQGQSAWTPLQRYLQRADSAEHKAEVLMLVGAVARKAQRHEEALRYYREVVETYPVPSALGDALYYRAALFERTRILGAEDEMLAARRQTAIGFYGAYLESGHDAHRPPALLGRARLLAAAGQHELALADYEAAVAAHPPYGAEPEVVEARVELLQGLERHPEAIALIATAREAPDLSRERRTTLQVREAVLRYEAQQCEQVEALLNPMPIIADRDLRPRAFFMRGFCRYQRGDWERATFDLEGLINDPEYQALALEPLLAAYEKSGQTSRLVNLAEELLRGERVAPTVPLLKRLAAGYGELGEPALMLSAYGRMADLDPQAVQTPDVQYRMGQAKETLGREEEAIAHYEAVLRRPETPTPAPREAPAVPPPPPAEAEDGEPTPPLPHQAAAPPPEVPATAEAPPWPPPEYLPALERLQVLYLKHGRLDDLQAAIARAESDLQDEAALAKLATLQRDLAVQAGRKALAAGETQRALQQLELALEGTPRAEPEQRAEVVALLIAGYSRSETPTAGIELYRAELEAAPDDAYRTRLSVAVLESLGEDSDALIAEGDRAGLIAAFRQALEDLPPERAQERYRAAQLLDRLYRQDGDHAARAALVQTVLKDGLDDETKQQLRVYQGRIYKDWGQERLEAGELDAAQFHLERSLTLTPAEDWRARYEVVSLLSRVGLQRKEYGDLILRNELLLPQVEDEALSAQLRHFLGQVYVDWGQAAADAGNLKSARIRYGYALDYLPPEDWQRQVAAANGLATALQKLSRPADAAAAYERVLPHIANPEVRQQYALYVGRLYGEQVQDASKAAHWYAEADRGGVDAISVEAGYRLADLQIAGKHYDAAAERLADLSARELGDSPWVVPIHYRIAVLHHRNKELQAALKHYRIVAGTQNEEARRLYPRSIEQSRTQAREIAAFLKAGGGQGVAVPQVNQN